MLTLTKNTLLPRRSISDNSAFEIRHLSDAGLSDTNPYEKGCVNNHYEMIWILKGNGFHRQNLEQQPVTDGSIFCIRPGQWHKLEAGGSTEGYAISFDESFIGIGDHETDLDYRSALIQLFESTQAIVVNNSDSREMQEIAQKMKQEFDQSAAFRTEILRRYLKLFLVYLARQFAYRHREKQRTRTVQLVARFFHLLEKDFSSRKMVREYAIQLSVTPNYLNEMVKKSTGNSAGFHVRQRVVLEAKKMVTYSDACTKEIAYCLGFSDLAHFSRFFKTNTGMNFSDFRKGKHQAVPAILSGFTSSQAC
jgi:AraC family transcriptional regulator, transcriptional activator of pobA